MKFRKIHRKRVPTRRLDEVLQILKAFIERKCLRL